MANDIDFGCSGGNGSIPDGVIIKSTLCFLLVEDSTLQYQASLPDYKTETFTRWNLYMPGNEDEIPDNPSWWQIYYRNYPNGFTCDPMWTHTNDMTEAVYQMSNNSYTPNSVYTMNDSKIISLVLSKDDYVYYANIKNIKFENKNFIYDIQSGIVAKTGIPLTRTARVMQYIPIYFMWSAE